MQKLSIVIGYFFTNCLINGKNLNAKYKKKYYLQVII